MSFLDNTKQDDYVESKLVNNIDSESGCRSSQDDLSNGQSALHHSWGEQDKEDMARKLLFGMKKPDFSSSPPFNDDQSQTIMRRPLGQAQENSNITLSISLQSIIVSDAINDENENSFQHS